jgi:hypothetical protein
MYSLLAFGYAMWGKVLDSTIRVLSTLAVYSPRSGLANQPGGPPHLGAFYYFHGQPGAAEAILV